MKNKLVWLSVFGLLLLLSGCVSRRIVYPTHSPTPRSTLAAPSPTPKATETRLPTATPLPTATSSPTPTPSQTPTITPTATPDTGVPAFSHIVVILLENREFGTVFYSSQMPVYHDWISHYTLLTQHYAITHPSLPNYLALTGGDTFGVTTNCSNCFIDAPNLADLIEASGRTWKTYQEDMPSACFVGDWGQYAQKHNPFIYYDNIRLNAERCQDKIVPYTQLQEDLINEALPDFVFITPNICNIAHDCDLKTADLWLGRNVPYLLSYPAIARDGLVIITWDEGQGDHGCCGIEPGGGRIATLLISPLVKNGFEDSTPYTHYSLLKTILAAWRLPELEHTADESTTLITLPWKP